MGNLLRILMNNDQPSSKASENFFVDFENVQPTESEERVWHLCKSVLDQATDIVMELQRYKGATEEIRMAISNPKIEELQEKAWMAVSPLVSKLKVFFEFSLELERVIPELLGELCSEDLSPREHLEQQQALFKQFAEILDFVLKFDDLKMTTPAVQNDFSYYRRTLNRRKMANEEEVQPGEEAVSNELANRMSLFYAQATPMLKALSDITDKFVTGNKELPVEQTTDCLSMMANICRVMIENPEYRSRIKDDTQLFCLRVMVGVIILYDHVHPVGAFAKTSGIEMKGCIKILKDQDHTNVESLLNALRYTTKHLQDDNTPRIIKSMLAD
ncbi:CYFIP-related Rac1 interactor B [Aplysia californica]|uniref:CYFIP-related Rac1 interactor B n=1 Tax=Aplysia californica TaxID=6500 RepID=A0ABM0JUC2_APLCA|nr:CYFIP-related Rac1 interactor B [Aplysia californica]XP_035826481.1 CYFIP-related Rac1 interactor B [Aplysia californica]